MATRMPTALPTPWTAYAHLLPSVSGMSYTSSYQSLATVHTCEEWGGLVSNLPAPQVFATQNGCLLLKGRKVVGISIFRDDVLPEWEDPRNTNGSTLVCRSTVTHDNVQAQWLNLCAACVVESISDVTGVQVLQKWARNAPQIRFDVWISAQGSVSRAVSQLQHECPLLAFEVSSREHGGHATRRK